MKLHQFKNLCLGNLTRNQYIKFSCQHNAFQNLLEISLFIAVALNNRNRKKSGLCKILHFINNIVVVKASEMQDPKATVVAQTKNSAF